MALKASIVYDHPYMQVFACLNDDRYREKYDGDIEKSDLIRKIAANTYLLYQKTKKVMVVASRDMVLIYHTIKCQHPKYAPKGGVIVFGFTPNPEMDQERPPTSAALRASAVLAGWLLEKLDDNTTKATLFLETDLKGGLGNWVIKKALQSQSKQLMALKKTIPQYLKE